MVTPAIGGPQGIRWIHRPSTDRRPSGDNSALRSAADVARTSSGTGRSVSPTFVVPPLSAIERMSGMVVEGEGALRSAAVAPRSTRPLSAANRYRHQRVDGVTLFVQGPRHRSGGCQRRSKFRQFRRLKIRQIDEGTSLSSSWPPDDEEQGRIVAVAGRRVLPAWR